MALQHLFAEIHCANCKPLLKHGFLDSILNGWKFAHRTLQLPQQQILPNLARHHNSIYQSEMSVYNSIQSLYIGLYFAQKIVH